MTEIIAAKDLKQYFDRLNNLEDEKQRILEDIKEVVKEAESNGFHGPTIRKVVQLAKKDPDKLAESEMQLSLYREAIGV